jgi:anaphase-promoting complex subunit 2
MDDKNSNNELVEELGRTEEPIDNQQNNRFNDDNWIPDPMDAGPGLWLFLSGFDEKKKKNILIKIFLFIDYKSSIYRSADIINLLVSLFDTTELITKEIQNQMASYLLAKTDYDTEKEVSYLYIYTFFNHNN